MGEGSRRAHLLCVYDEYVNGYRDRSAIFAPEHGAEITGRGAAVTQVYLVDGQVLGTWTRIQRRHEIGIVLNPFDDSMPSLELETVMRPAADDFGRFLGVQAVLSVVEQ